MPPTTKIDFDLMMKALEYGSTAHAIKDTDSMNAEELSGHDQMRTNILVARNIWNSAWTHLPQSLPIPPLGTKRNPIRHHDVSTVRRA